MPKKALSTGDRLAIHELLASINHHFDAGDATRFIGCFEPDARMTGSREATGHAELSAWVDGSTSRPPHRHFTTNVVISDSELPERASAHSSWIYLEWSDGALRARMGTYSDELVKRDGGWRVVKREALYDWSRTEPMAALTGCAPK
jgi:hypothetical protein